MLKDNRLLVTFGLINMVTARLPTIFVRRINITKNEVLIIIWNEENNIRMNFTVL